jgi:hypothetical protein
VAATRATRNTYQPPVGAMRRASEPRRSAAVTPCRAG